MKNSKHTPGPWKIHRGFNFLQVDGPNYGVCKLSRATTGKVDGRDKNDKESIADARLIAAAPEMLEVLETLASIYGDMSRTNFDLVEIRKLISGAIAKARGET